MPKMKRLDRRVKLGSESKTRKEGGAVQNETIKKERDEEAGRGRKCEFWQSAMVRTLKKKART